MLHVCAGCWVTPSFWENALIADEKYIHFLQIKLNKLKKNEVPVYYILFNCFDDGQLVSLSGFMRQLVHWWGLAAKPPYLG